MMTQPLGPPPVATPVMPLCPKCQRNGPVVFLGESRAFVTRGKPPVKVYGCTQCQEEFVPRTPNDHPAFVSDGVPPRTIVLP